jgi:hypothetical protein
MRRFEFDYLSAGLSALVCSFVSANLLYGIEYMSYIWEGVGLYTQLWAMFFLPLALAEMYRTVVKGDGSLFWSVLLTIIVTLSHPIYGYVLIISSILFLFLTLDGKEIVSKAKRLLPVLILTALTTAYFFIPFFIDKLYLNRSLLEDPAKYTSYGFVSVLNTFLSGNLLDYNRLPILTILFMISLVFVIGYYREEKYGMLLLVTFFWFIIYFGPALWGNFVYTVLPFSYDIQYHRFVGIVQIGAVMITGAGLSLALNRVKDRFNPSAALIVGIVILLALTPVLFERVHYYKLNTDLRWSTKWAFIINNEDVTNIENTLDTLPPGRVYAGMMHEFGVHPDYMIGNVPVYSLLPQLGFDSFSYAYTAFPLITDVRLYFDNTKPEQYNLFNIRYVLLRIHGHRIVFY